MVRNTCTTNHKLNNSVNFYKVLLEAWIGFVLQMLIRDIYGTTTTNKDIMLKNIIVTALHICFACSLLSQPSNETHDSLYYENWVGSWYKEVDGELDESPTFVVKRALYHTAFEEYWMGAGGDFSKAWRAWDSRTQSWEFAWMSTDALFQTWEGRKVDDIWYMYKTFIIGDRAILSRQAFIPQDKTTFIRTSEHSEDNGETWRLRFTEVYRKR